GHGHRQSDPSRDVLFRCGHGHVPSTGHRGAHLEQGAARPAQHASVPMGDHHPEQWCHRPGGHLATQRVRARRAVVRAGARRPGPVRPGAPRAAFIFSPPPSMSQPTRAEKDPLGELPVPESALYGVQTVRAVQNFPISGLRPLPMFVDAVVLIKRSAALTHQETGRLEARLAGAIVAAADEVLAGQHRDHFVVDVYQAGAGTSHNMNVNEVLANRANEILGGRRGAYTPVHPNDHVNMAQSTNDVIPTAIRLGVLALLRDLEPALAGLRDRFLDKGREFDDVIKCGRTHLQDAMPIRLGQEFRAYGITIERNARRLTDVGDFLRDLGIGGSAVGTGVNVEPQYPSLMIRHLRKVTGLDLREGEDRVQLMQSMGDVAGFSAQLRTLAVDLSKIASDLRLLASGPRTGFDEIVMPAVQPGSSIMPG